MNGSDLSNLATIALVTLTGAVVMGAIIWSGFSDVLAESLVMILFAAIGAALAGLATFRLFGRSGLVGWAQAATGAVLATALGSALGGSLFYTVGVTVFGIAEAIPVSEVPQVATLTVLVVFSMLATLKVGPPWVIGMVIVHLVTRFLRRTA